MKQLSGLDATFLYLETPEMPMHVGALHLLELPPGFKGRFVTALRQHMASRLPVAPALRRRPWWMPLNLAAPAWVDAEPDMKAHVVEIRLPKVDGRAAGMAEVQSEVGRLHSVLLDRSRPLWKFHVFEGLAPGPGGVRRVAVYSQLHHAAVDGQAAVALANAILDTGPVPRRIEGRPSGRKRVFELEMVEMLRGVIGSQAQKVAHIVRELPSTVGTLKDAATHVLAGTELFGGKGLKNLALAPRTPLNVSVTRGRSFAAVSLPLPELRALGRAHGATLNDMVLMLCSSALRRWLGARRELPRQSMVAAVPISLREKGDTSSDNQASMSLVSLGTHIADPARRLAHVMAATAAMKETMGSLKSVLPTDFPSLGVPWLLEAATSLYGKAKVADRLPPLANVVISNVPGPPITLYMAGARMLTNYPTSIVVHGVALNITVQSYDQSMDFGLMADAAAAPDLQALADAIRVALDDLRGLPRPGDADHESTVEPVELVGKAARRIGGAISKTVRQTVGQTVGKVTRSVVGSAVEAAVAGATAGPRKRAAAAALAARRARR